AALPTEGERTQLVRRFGHLRNEQISNLGAFVDLAAKLKADRAVQTLLLSRKRLTKERERERDDAAFLTPSAKNKQLPRPRSASVVTSSPTAFLSQIAQITSGTPSSFLTTASTTLNNSSSTPSLLRTRRSASLSRTIKKQSSTKSLFEHDSILKSLKNPLDPRWSKTAVASAANRAIKDGSIAPIGSLSLIDQESFVLEDLCYVLLGIDGIYIKQKVAPQPTRNQFLDEPTPIKTEYTIDPSLDPSLASLISRILPLASHHLLIADFITSHSHFEYGKVCHALTAALRNILNDYLQLIAQLEHQIHFAPGFGLQKLWYHVLPSIHLLGLVSDLIIAIKEAEKVSRDDDFTMLGNTNNVPAERGRSTGIIGGMVGGMAGNNSSSFGSIGELRTVTRGGGVVLGVIADKVLTMSGDATAKLTYTHLLTQASRPYFQILHTWIHEGQIHDPYDEFLVQERRGMSKTLMTKDFNDAYWEQRYTLRAAPNGGGMIPCFLDGVKEKILLAGKYLNVVRECGVDIGDVVEERVVKGFEEGGEFVGKVAAFGDVVRVVEDGKFIEDIERAYRFANQTLLELLFEGNQLVNRLRSLKHYMLLDQSDFLTHFLDLGYSELLKSSSCVSVESLTSMLELVLRNPGSVSYLDPYKDDITVELSSTSLVEQLLRVTSVVGVDYRDVFMEGADGSTMVDLSRVHLGVSSSSMDGDNGERELRGIDAITLGYNATFPVSLIINKRVLTKYQLLFRHLLHCKNVERMLTNVWADKAKFLRRWTWTRVKSHRTTAMASSAAAAASRQQGIKRQRSIQSLNEKPALRVSVPETPAMSAHELKEESVFLSRISNVQGRMLMFVQQFLHFICFDVIEPSWVAFERDLANVTTVEEVLKIHNDFLDTCLKDCLLTNQKLLKYFGNLMSVCADFSEFATAFLVERFGALYPTEDDEENLESTQKEPQPPQFTSLSSTSQASQTLAKFEERQIGSMTDFIHALQFADSISAFDGASGTTV
ncbi:UNVERIFIED_CONTAM: hypothetical protein HDU68_005274, partial [Siphonaria sp. JEL0065]